MWKILKLLQQKLILSIPAFMLLGLLFGAFFPSAFLKEWIVPVTFLMVYPMMVTLNMKELFSKGGTKVQIAALLINFVVTPFLGFFIGRLFFPDQPLVVLGLLLTSLLPTSGMTISWTGFAKGNMSAAVKMTIIGLIVGSLAAPIYLKLLMGTVVSISLVDVFSQILFIVFLPLVSTLGVLGIVFISMALKAKTILGNPAVLLYYLLPLGLLYLVNFTISTLAGKYLFGRNDGIALVYGTVMRNLSIALAIAMSAFGENGSDIALIIALAYIIQVQAGAWYVKFTDRFFGAPAPLVAAPEKQSLAGNRI